MWLYKLNWNTTFRRICTIILARLSHVWALFSAQHHIRHYVYRKKASHFLKVYNLVGETYTPHARRSFIKQKCSKLSHNHQWKVVPLVNSVMNCIPASQPEAILPSRGHVAMLGTFWVVTTGGGGIISILAGKRPGMLHRTVSYYSIIHPKCQ